jgi:2-keto-4-pentenoate hydratase/2-oxohepta-3-ene-1,7-dioic acid hydratase in catechol pathway
MRFLRFSANNTASWGVIIDGGIIDLGCRFGSSLHQSISENQLAGFADKILGLTIDYRSDEITWLPPIEQPEKIACIGVNYANRNAEYKDGSTEAKFPSLFMRTPDSLTGHNCPILRPPESVQLDYEGEIVIIIGKGGRRIPEDRAYEHIAGLTIMNEGTLRDWIRHAKFNVTQGKNFVHSGAIGPWMVSADEFSAQQYENMRVTTHVNGELRQDDTTANLMFPFKYIISYLSTFYQLKPGDVIATGTPNGAGARFDPPRWLVPGDTVTVKVEGVGTLENTIEDEIVT